MRLGKLGENDEVLCRRGLGTITESDRGLVGFLTKLEGDRM